MIHLLHIFNKKDALHNMLQTQYSLLTLVFDLDSYFWHWLVFRILTLVNDLGPSFDLDFCLCPWLLIMTLTLVSGLDPLFLNLTLCFLTLICDLDSWFWPWLFFLSLTGTAAQPDEATTEPDRHHVQSPRPVFTAAALPADAASAAPPAATTASPAGPLLRLGHLHQRWRDTEPVTSRHGQSQRSRDKRRGVGLLTDAAWRV